MLIKFTKDDNLTSNPEAKRKFQMWKANTTALLLEAFNAKQEDEHEVDRKCVQEVIQDIFESLRSISKSKDKDILRDQISRLIAEALDLDKLINSQVAEVTWVSDLRQNAGRFNEDLMETEQGEKRQPEDSKTFVTLICIAPAMIKRGKSTGEDFDVTNMLLKMTVSCIPRGSHVPKLPPRPTNIKGAWRPFFRA